MVRGMNYLLCILESLLAVNLLVVVHEFGHMIAGKAFGVPSHRFCIGLGPRLFGFRFRGTEYCFSPVPLGGYVQLDSGHRHGEGRTCMDCLSPWKKMLVYFAGPAANLIFVLVLFWTVFFVLGYKDNVPVVGKVDAGSPAFQAGFLTGDRILSIDGKKIISWTQAAVEFDRSQGRSRKVAIGSPGPEGEGGILSQGDSGGFRTLDVTRADLAGAFPAEETVRLRLGPVHAAKKSMEKLSQLSKLLFESVTGLMTSRVSPSELVGPLYLFHVSAQTAAESQVSLVYLLAVISACLFFFNLLPLPVLDGGQIVLAMLEKVLKRPLAPQSMRLLIHASVVWLVLLMASATLNDIVRLLGS
jgi:regulator of sigma E protease